MATYRGRINPDSNRPYRGILVTIFDINGTQVGLTSSDGDGLYSFIGLITG